jgi:hypothetical protein
LGGARLFIFPHAIRRADVSSWPKADAQEVPFDVRNLECAPDGGQIAAWELTGAAGLSEDESHGQAPHP